MKDFNIQNIMETIEMIKVHHLDIRTVTLALSLRDCASEDIKTVGRKVYDKILKHAGKLSQYAQELENEFSIPIINKRIAVTPISLIAESCTNPDYVYLAQVLDKAAEEIGIDFIGGYSALVEKGCTNGDKKFIESIPEALATTKRVCSSLNLATSKAGINMVGVLKTANVIKRAAELTKDADGLGAAKFVCFCNSVTDNPFMAGAYFGINETEAALNVGGSGPGVVRWAI